MRLLLFAFLLLGRSLGAGSATGQALAPLVLTGAVRDGQTQRPVPYASVSLLHTTVGTVSNGEGAFRLQVAGHAADTVLVQALGYAAQKQALSATLLANPPVFSLQPQAMELAPVRVTGPSPTALLNQAVRQTRADMASPLLLKTYYREFVTRDGVYTKFADALIDYYLEANPRQPEHPTVQAQVLQSRVGESPAHGGGLLTALLPKPLDVTMAGDYYNILQSSPFLDSTAFYFYTYRLQVLVADAETNEATGYVITCTPRTRAERHLRQATVYIDPTTLHIRRIESEVPVALQPYNYSVRAGVVSANVTTFYKRLEYREVHGRVYPAFVRMERGWQVVALAKAPTQYNFSSELVVTDLGANPAPIPHAQRYAGPLFRRGTRYEYPYWLESNAVAATKAEERAIQELSK
ncbi:carboxypeptidase-like regulatory domain-containing protein [Hymenobacter monticola]|uniref:Carboxypeptidase-like regulatory domain-containing protein n=3 Tax=Hymenobacter monticola TaxID=1705399 RepID=A0ABY4B719_9BACT|nr:carboxypeptidase-like regulatory domain-containing protein [Hymenobacter monticola]UOE33580.1 carboxypeptidase-like regulatory domain-containing protein [Hymenobacter monticola]UOE34923.1 carboxypeptidase-like regulatory domain-containing protein [Hymenobacter monticola]